MKRYLTKDEVITALQEELNCVKFEFKVRKEMGVGDKKVERIIRALEYAIEIIENKE